MSDAQYDGTFERSPVATARDMGHRLGQEYRSLKDLGIARLVAGRDVVGRNIDLGYIARVAGVPLVVADTRESHFVRCCLEADLWLPPVPYPGEPYESSSRAMVLEDIL